MSAWTDFVTSHYRQMSKTNPNYKFKDALVDAAKEYKKNGGKTEKNKTSVNKKRRSSKRRSRKNRV